MSKQKKSAINKPDRKKESQAKASQAQPGVAGPSSLPNDLLAAAPAGDIEGQMARLDDSRLQTAQRQTLAVQIGRKHGNQHLQRVMRTASRPKGGPRHLLQRHWLPGEEEEVQTKSLLQRHWLPGEEEEVQTKPLTSRPRTSPAFGVGLAGRLKQRPGGSNLWAKQNHAGSLQRQWKKGDAPAAAPAGPKIGEERVVTLSPVTFDKSEAPADGLAKVQAAVKTTPANRDVVWSIAGNDYNSTISNSGAIIAGNDLKGQEKADLQVKATDKQQPGVFSTGTITLWDAKLYQAKLDFPKFVAGTYTYPNFTIGLNGKFDLVYQPAAKLANVNVKVKFAFPEDADIEPSISNLFGLLGKKEREARQAGQKTYIDNFIKQITAQWSGRYQFNNVREPQSVWGKLNPTTVKVNVVEVKQDQHFTIEVRQKTKGRASVGGGTAKLFKGSDVPAPAFNPGTAQGELARVTRNTPTPILFGNNSADVPGPDQNKLQFLGTYLSRINNPKFNIDIVGHASATGDKAQNQTLSEKRAQAVEAVLKGAGLAQHKITAAGVGQTGAGKGAEWRKVDIASSLPVGWQNLQDVTAHEFGHMIGLGDEYAGGGSPVATHYDLVKKAFGQAYADEVAKRGDTDYASIMEGGNDVRIQHYVTFWSALCETTQGKAATPTPKFGYDDWKFIG